MLPRLAPQLQHDPVGRIGGIEPDVDGEFALVRDREGLPACGRRHLQGFRGHDVEATFARLRRLRGRGFDPADRASGVRPHHRPVRPAFGEPERLPPAGRRATVGRIDVARLGDRLVEGLLVRSHVAVDRGDQLFLPRRLQRQRGRRPPRIAVEAGIGRRIEERIERIKLLVGDRVELVAVADGALAGEPEPGVRHRGGAIDGVAEEQFFIDRSSLARRDVAPRETGGDLLVGRRIRQQVAGELPDRELVEREIVVEGLHHPVAVEPHLPLVVEVEAVGVGVAGVVEPVTCHLLAVVRARKKFLDELGMGIGGCIGDERGHLLRRGGQSREGERETADERGAVRLGVHRQLGDGEGVAEKPVDRVGGLACRHLRPRDRPVGPVLLIRRSRLDPPREQLLLLGRERLLRMRRRHDHAGIGGVDPDDHFTGRRVAGHDRPHPAREPAGCLLGRVEPQARLLLSRPVAGVAVFGKDRPDVAVEPKRRLGGCGRAPRDHPEDRRHDDTRSNPVADALHASTSVMTRAPSTPVSFASRPWNFTLKASWRMPS